MQLVVGDSRSRVDGSALQLLVEGLEVAGALTSARYSRQTKEGLRTTRAAGQHKGRRPRRAPSQEQVFVECFLAGRFGATDVSEIFDVSRSTVWRAAQITAESVAPGFRSLDLRPAGFLCLSARRTSRRRRWRTCVNNPT